MLSPVPLPCCLGRAAGHLRLHPALNATPRWPPRGFCSGSGLLSAERAAAGAGLPPPAPRSSAAGPGGCSGRPRRNPRVGSGVPSARGSHSLPGPCPLGARGCAPGSSARARPGPLLGARCQDPEPAPGACAVRRLAHVTRREHGGARGPACAALSAAGPIQFLSLLQFLSPLRFLSPPCRGSS